MMVRAFDAESLNNEEIVELVRTIKSIKTLSNREFGKIIDSNESRIANILADRSRVKPDDLYRIQDYLINHFSDHEKLFINDKFSGKLFEKSHIGTHYQLFFERVMGKNFSWKNSDIDENCTGHLNGMYALIRLEGQRKLVISKMVVFSSTRDLPPQYITSRKTPYEVRKRTRGLLFEYESDVYALGRTYNGEGLHFMRLNIVKRLGRHDFVGLRLSQSTAARLPCAYRVYAYQMKKDRSPNQRKQLFKIHSRDELETVSQEIWNIEGIIKLLEVQDSEDNFIISRTI